MPNGLPTLSAIHSELICWVWNFILQLTHYTLSSKKNVHLLVFNESTPISEKDHENIFQRFYRLDQSRSHQGGFGLGLSIAATIAKEHGGKIWLKTPAKTGNEFHVSLPKHIDN